MKARFAGRWALCILVGVAAAGCGRKGPPLPPLVRLPGTVVDLTAKRLGDQVVLQFTVPVANSDNSRPADLEHVQVYAHTGPLPSPADFLQYGVLVGTIPIKLPASLASTQSLPGVDQGAKAGLAEAITAAELQIGKMPTPRGPAPLNVRVPQASDLETEGTVNAPLPTMRYYVAVGTSRRNRRGNFSAPLAVPLVTPPEPVSDVAAEYTAEAVALSWTAASRSEDIFAPPPAYNVYEVPDQAGAIGPAPPTMPLLAPALNPTVLTEPAFKDTRMTFGVRRCYVVRTVRRMGLVSVESQPVDPICLTLTDTFPPAAPKGLAAVASEGTVSLIWEPNTDADLDGYVVLRAEAGSDTLAPITPTPIHDTTYRDTSVKSGISYMYVVVAVDNAPTPNTSSYSNRVQETAQ